MVRSCTPKWRFACLREAASAKAGHAGVGALRAWGISLDSAYPRWADEAYPYFPLLSCVPHSLIFLNFLVDFLPQTVRL
jgi:hypothetical protein